MLAYLIIIIIKSLNKLNLKNRHLWHHMSHLPTQAVLALVPGVDKCDSVIVGDTTVAAHLGAHRATRALHGDWVGARRAGAFIGATAHCT